MATYNKRGYKAPKPAEVNEVEPEETFDGQSTTEEVFNTLDEKASKTEEWVANNQKPIIIAVAVIAVALVGYLFYGRVVVEPKETEAANDSFQAQQYFIQASNATTVTEKDSLYNLALNGGEAKMGLLSIVENYSGTDAANVANYMAGMAYLNTGKYKEAVERLQEYKGKELTTGILAKGGIGDAFAQTGENEEALKYYAEAAKMGDDALATPRFLFKAGQTALTLGKKEEANKYFNELKTKYESAPEANNIDAYIAATE
ncbi:tetratricopeptide repeat protein [Flavobacterium rakeshii]|uniref:tetratricopeptide repeat protein n=1 Tax=Flavobacterium rakeshii TaxID=1038845 RepID=UPI002E7C3029|nr:tetratricopeptide repeat protein [Flavobacterium rakeshii]MEE1896929.1 tetratricopeptide repeat protein [Flavobacterium rakeshii]